VARLDAAQHGFDVLRGILYVFDAHGAAEKEVFIRIVLVGWDDTRTVDHVDAFHEGDVLPDFGFAGDGGDDADFLFAERVDDGRLARVGVADHADGDLLAVTVQGGELAEEGDKGSFAEAVVDGSVECCDMLVLISIPALIIHT
jgi:hypothetical protein